MGQRRRVLKAEAPNRKLPAVQRRLIVTGSRRRFDQFPQLFKQFNRRPLVLIEELLRFLFSEFGDPRLYPFVLFKPCRVACGLALIACDPKGIIDVLAFCESLRKAFMAFVLERWQADFPLCFRDLNFCSTVWRFLPFGLE